jgi:protease-4
MLRLLLLVLPLMVSVGCTPYRLVVDVTAPREKLTETTVRTPDGGEWSSAKIAIIDLDGMIIDRMKPGLLGAGRNPTSEFIERLWRAEADEAVKAIIVRINSPGGSVAASETLYNELRAFSARSGKPIVVLMGEIAASGGYYVALAGDRIIAQPSSVTGSIGVLIQLINVSEGMARIGIHAHAVTSGPNKRMGSPLEPEEPEHRAIFQSIVDDFYATFRGLVLERRPGISPDELDELADGRVMTGAQAHAHGLVDATGSLADAQAAAQELAGITRAALVKYHRPSRYVGTPYAPAAEAGGTEVNLLQLRLDGWSTVDAGFYYLWAPSLMTTE